MRWTSLLSWGLFVLVTGTVAYLSTLETAAAGSPYRGSASEIGALVLGPLPLLVVPAPAVEQWGDVKGRIVWGAEKLPQRPDKDLIIDPKTKAVKNVFIWLVPDSRVRDDLTKPIPIHPDLRELKEAQVTIDIGNGQFAPHLIALREGQSLNLKNKTNALQSVKIDANEDMGNLPQNLLVPAGEARLVGPYKPQWTTIPMTSLIRPNMDATIWVFSHPYYGVTEADGQFVLKNAPAGAYRLVIWHVSHGWVVGDKNPDKFGMRIQIPAGKELDLGDLKMKVME